MGEFQFGYLHGFMDCRYSEREGNETVEFSWEGNDEMDQASGRGFAIINIRLLLKKPVLVRFSKVCSLEANTPLTKSRIHDFFL